MMLLQLVPSLSRDRKAIFFDRDGVINKLIEVNGEMTSPKNKEEFKFLPNVFGSVRKMQDRGYMTFIVTNQPGISEGKQTPEELAAINKMLLSCLMVDGIYNATDKSSNLYKPENGMLEFFINYFNLNREKSYIIGDRWKDIVPGFNSGINTVFVGSDYTPTDEYKDIKPDYYCADIFDACNFILEKDYDRN